MADRFDQIESKIDSLTEKVSNLSVVLATLQAVVVNATRAADEWPSTDRRLALLESRKPTWDLIAESKVQGIDTNKGDIARLDLLISELIKENSIRKESERQLATERNRRMWQVWMAMVGAILGIVIPFVRAAFGM